MGNTVGGFIRLGFILLLAALQSNGFSIEVPASRLIGLGYEPRSGELTADKRYRQEVPLSALLQRSEHDRNNILKRTGTNAKPATCTCTCETKPVDPSSQAYKRFLNSKSQRQRSYSNYEGDYDNHPVKKFQKTHHETPATCTCTCETHPTDEAQPANQPSGPSSSHSGPSPSHSGPSHQKNQKQVLDSIFWNDGEDYNYNNGGHNGWGDKPQSAALTSNNNQESKQEASEEGGWGHTSRYPWKNLPDTICYRDRCEKDSDCCMRFNLCDRSAKVCVDCWYGASCEDESDCCYKYPICKTESYPAHNGVPGAVVVTGKCVGEA